MFHVRCHNHILCIVLFDVFVFCCYHFLLAPFFSKCIKHRRYIPVFFIYFNLCKSFCLGINKQILCLHALNGYRLFSVIILAIKSRAVLVVHNFQWNDWKIEKPTMKIPNIIKIMLQSNMTFTRSMFNVDICLGRIAFTGSSRKN